MEHGTASDQLLPVSADFPDPPEIRFLAPAVSSVVYVSFLYKLWNPDS